MSQDTEQSLRTAPCLTNPNRVQAVRWTSHPIVISRILMLWVKAFHILFVTSWFAGLFYLPRIYVNLAQSEDPAVRAALLRRAAARCRLCAAIRDRRVGARCVGRCAPRRHGGSLEPGPYREGSNGHH